MNQTVEELFIRSGNNYARILPQHGGTISHLLFENADGKLVDQLWRRYKHDPDPGSWPDGGIPMLFPFAGRVWVDNQVGRYRVAGHEYPMGIHGFLFGKPSRVLEQEEARVVLEFLPDQETQACYPWYFRVTAVYEIEGPHLTMAVTVSHEAKESRIQDPMPVALGFHPYFQIPTKLSECPDHIRLQLHARRAFRVAPGGSRGEEFSSGDFHRLSLRDPDFRNTIIERVPDTLVGLDGKEKGARLVLRTTGPLNTLVLWGEPHNSFICIEPWMAHPDAPHQEQGVQHLGAGDSLLLGLSIALEYV